jgi:hypothetical protein
MGRVIHEKPMRKFPALKKKYWGSHLWGRGYFCCTVGAVTEEIVKRYIEDQDDHPQGFKTPQDLARPHTLRIHLQMLDRKPGSVQARSYPAHAGTKQLD